MYPAHAGICSVAPPGVLDCARARRAWDAETPAAAPWVRALSQRDWLHRRYGTCGIGTHWDCRYGECACVWPPGLFWPDAWGRRSVCCVTGVCEQRRSQQDRFDRDVERLRRDSIGDDYEGRSCRIDIGRDVDRGGDNRQAGRDTHRRDGVAVLVYGCVVGRCGRDRR